MRREREKNLVSKNELVRENERENQDNEKGDGSGALKPVLKRTNTACVRDTALLGLGDWNKLHEVYSSRSPPPTTTTKNSPF